MSQIYVALDTETTGLRPESDAIIEVAAVRFDLEGNVLGTYASLVNPQAPIPAKIQRITGIKQLDVAGAPPLRDVAPRLLSFVQSAPVVGHNVQFDLAFLQQKGYALPNPRLDTFELAGIVLPKMTSYSLEALTRALEISSPAYHRALADAVLTKDLLLALFNRALDLDLETLTEINRLAVKSPWSLRELFGEIEKRKARFGLMGSIREQLSSKGALDVLGGDLTAGARIVPVAARKPLNVDSLAGILEEGGLLSRHFPGYEHRPQQIDMLRAVAETFNTDGYLMVEAGTGVGKSLSYLIPAAHFAVANGRRVVISTNTINLQDQLYNKDIPDLQAILERPGEGHAPLHFTAALVKGRANYLCARRWSFFRQRADLSPDELRLAAKILVWLPTTLTGERGELTINVPAENAAWSRVNAQSESCQPDTCIYFRRNQCYLYRARKQAESAHLVVVNHALLLSDMAAENRILPDYQHLIVDEAHHLEDVATDQLGFAANQRDVFALLDELSPADSGRGRDTGPGGYLSTVPAHFLGSEVSRANQDAVQKQIAEVHGRLQRTRQAVHDFFSLLATLMKERQDDNDNGRPAPNDRRGGRPTYDQPMRVTQGIRNSGEWTEVELAWENLQSRLSTVQDGLDKLQKGIAALTNQGVTDLDALVADLQGFVTRVATLRAQGTAIVSEPDRQGIYWLTAGPDGDVSLRSAPLYVGDLLCSGLFGPKETVILTSATLTTDGAFRFMRQRLGLEDTRELWVDSPFDYKSACLLVVPSDMPEPNQQGYQRALEQGLIALARATRGRMLVLFTSHSAVRSTYQAVSGVLEADGIPVLGQGLDGQPRQLIERFKTTPQSVLMGTSSFWEGIDVVGDALSVLVIAKLPFAVPTDPIFAARSETFDSPFSEYSVPQTILKFKQGFGRLIRSQTDRGVVAVLDRRVISKAYGRSFLESLPGCTEVKDRPLASLPTMAKAWLERQTLARSPSATPDEEMDEEKDEDF